MREIKFRAYDNEINKMFYVDIYEYMSWNEMAQDEAITYEARENGLMQYTGLKDKNGKEIYEGDVLKSIENEEAWRVDEIVPLHRHDHVTNIGYFSGKKYHLRENPAGQYNNLDDWMSLPEMYEIVGNIYQNPELLPPNTSNE